MNTINYLDTLKQALLITWKNKFLWLFGFLVFLSSIGSNFNLSNGNAVDQEKRLQVFSSFIQNNPSLSIAIGLILILVIVSLLVLRILAVAGIIKAVNDINLYRQLSIVAILKEAKKYFWRLFFLELLIVAVSIVVALVLATPVVYLFALGAKVLASVAMATAVVIMLPLITLAYYLHRYAVFYIVLTNEKLTVSLESAYAIFAKNIKESLVMGLVAIATGILLVIAIFFVGVLLAIVFSPLGLIAYLLFAKTGAAVLLVMAMLVWLVASVTIFSWHEAFLQAAWLMFFQQISFIKQNEKKIADKVEVKGKIPSPEVV